MKVIVNKGQKIINIGTVALLPDAELSDAKAVETALANPVIKSLINKGKLVVKEKAAKKAEKAAAPAATPNGSDGTKEDGTKEDGKAAK